MSIFEAFLLGILQGITEFFPVSSSGHLKLGEMLLGLQNLEQYVTFDLVCHVGTLFAIILVLWREVWAVLTKDRQMFGLLFIACLPLIPLYFVLHGIKAIYGSPEYLGFFFLLSGLILWTSERFARVAERAPRVKDALVIGCAQAFALLPAVSRSGSTIAAARLLGWDRVRAARFSFLLAIPTILGGLVVESRHLTASTLPLSTYFVGFITSFIVGLFFLRLLFVLLRKITLKPFALYCTLLGLATIVWTHL